MYRFSGIQLGPFRALWLGWQPRLSVSRHRGWLGSTWSFRAVLFGVLYLEVRREVRAPLDERRAG